LALSVSCLD